MIKNFIYIILSCVLLTSCVMESSYDEQATDRNKETVSNLFKAFNKHDFELVASYYADTAKFLDPLLGKAFVHQSAGQTIARYTGMATKYTDLKDSTTNLIASQNKVITQFISTGSAADGTVLSLPVCTVFLFSNGKIVANATYYDTK